MFFEAIKYIKKVIHYFILLCNFIFTKCFSMYGNILIKITHLEPLKWKLALSKYFFLVDKKL